MEEEGRLLGKQLEEDLRIYGSRVEPSDAVEVDEDEHLAKLPPRKPAPEFKAGVIRLSESRAQDENSASTYENVTAMDWNAGESPMLAWLNQSAIPAAVPNSTLLEGDKNDPLDNKSHKFLEQETKEIEVFRNVQIEFATEDTTRQLPSHKTPLYDLDLGAQIYYRNIEDKYPYLEPFLIKRLAIANYDRAERLRRKRKEVEEARLK